MYVLVVLSIDVRDVTCDDVTCDGFAVLHADTWAHMCKCARATFDAVYLGEPARYGPNRSFMVHDYADWKNDQGMPTQPAKMKPE